MRAICSILLQALPWPVTLLLTVASAVAEVPTHGNAAVLDGPELTPVGAQRSGNADGDIPPWTGGITEPIPGYSSGSFHPDPYAGEKPLFSIHAGNLSRYRHRLSDGQRALLQAYPDSWRLNVYPTHRSAAYPEFVYEALKRNASEARLLGGDRFGVENASVSSPFPLPTSGLEVIWNHNLRWRGIHVRRTNGQTAVTRVLGRFRVVLYDEEIGFPYGLPPDKRESRRFLSVSPDVAIAFKQRVFSPGLLAGNGQLLVESVQPDTSPRNTWVYSPELRRVFRTPFSGFDNPAPHSEGLRTNDEFDMFNGSPELYDWQLLGKREIYIPYNAYRLHSNEHSFDDILQPNHINPELARYELHRVWVVEGRLKSGERHIYARRVFYLDEDSWQIALAEAYDSEDRLWRVSEGHILNFYQVPLVWTTMEVYHDLKQRRYLVNGLDNNHAPGEFREDINPRTFSPNALHYYVR